MSKRISLTTQTHSIIEQIITEGDMAIDATVGNGYDTVFLAKQVGCSGKVFGFDIQQQAIESTEARLESENIRANTSLFHASHDKMSESIASKWHGKIKVIMFNLGYLPGSDKSIITETESTIAALSQSLELLAKAGILTIAAYPGHAGGDTEAQSVDCWLQQLSTEKYQLQTIYSSEKQTAPRLYIINKR